MSKTSMGAIGELRTLAPGRRASVETAREPYRYRSITMECEKKHKKNKNVFTYLSFYRTRGVLRQELKFTSGYNLNFIYSGF